MTATAPTESTPCQRKVITLPGGVEFAIIKIPAGTYTMGSPPDESGRWEDEKQKEVTVASLWVWETATTQAQWRAVMGTDPSYFKGDDRPVERVSWHDCCSFCEKLNALLGQQHPDVGPFRLPTEAEWEYACRAGTTGPLNVPGATLDEVAWHNGNSGGETHPVKQKKPNAWGLYDMLGNVCEWCQDVWTR
jgi:formylglycine-generating enzyme required for sulfatase activity